MLEPSASMGNTAGKHEYSKAHWKEVKRVENGTASVVGKGGPAYGGYQNVNVSVRDREVYGKHRPACPVRSAF